MSLVRINFLIVLLVALLMGGGYYFFYAANQFQMKDEAIGRIKGNLLELGYSISKVAEIEGLAATNSFLYRAVTIHEEYESLSLVVEGNLVYSTQKVQEGKHTAESLPLNALTTDSLYTTQCYFHLFYYFDAGIKKELALHVNLDESYLRQKEHELLHLIEQQSVFLFLLMSFVFFVLFRVNIRPVMQLTKNIQTAPQQLPTFAIREFMDLRTAFMLKYTEAADLIVTLEHKVKERTEHLNKTNELFSEAQRMTHLGNWEWDITQDAIHWSDEIYSIFGLEPKAFAATYDALINTVHSDDREKVKQAIEQAIKESKTYSVTHRIVLPDGKIKIVLERGEVKYDPDGKAINMQGTVQDITEQQHKEDALLLQAEVLNSIADAIFVHPQNGKFIYVNQAACSTRGFTQEEFFNMRVEDLDAPCSCADSACDIRIQEIKKQIAKTGEAIFEVEHRRKHADPIPVEIASRIFQKDGQTFFISIARDTSERKKTQRRIEESEMKFRSLVENALVGVYTSDIHGNIHYVNPALVHLMEYDSAEELMRSSSVIVYKDPRERVKMLNILEKEGKITNYELELITKKKRQITILISAVFDGHILSGTIIDISKEKLAHEEITKLSSAIEQIDDIVSITNRGGIIEYVNEAFVTQTGYTREEVYGKKVNILKSGEHTQKFYEELWSTILSGNVYKNRIINQKKNGEHYYEQKTITPLKNERGSITTFISTAKDVTQTVLMEQKLERMARVDQLTGICNRHSFEEFYDKEIARATRYEKPLSLIMFDIDHFKKVNDTYGHDAGDTVLKKVVDIVGQAIRKSDIFARWGGEEFLVLCSDTDEQQAVVLADKLREKISAHHFDAIGRVTASFGVTQFVPEEIKEKFLKRVDNALYRAKERGRDRVEIS